MAKTQNVSGPIFDFLKSYRGQNVSISDIEAATGFTRLQVINGLASLRRAGVEIKTVIGGQIFRLLDVSTEKDSVNVKTTDVVSNNGTGSKRRLFEEVGRGKIGIVIQDETGKLYRAEEL